jgi:NNP family nitrate/nitrite transporter-like MFS transporter
MDNLAEARSTFRDSLSVVRIKQTWVVTWLYIGAFGSFIGYSAALPLLIKTQFPGVDPLAYAFLGPLVGSVARPFGGWLSDRRGGSRVTMAVFAAMSVVTPLLVVALHAHAFGAFLGVFLVLFVLAGMGNGSVFRMVPTIFSHETDDPVVARRHSAAAIGISSAVAAYGGFFIPQAYRTSIHATGSIDLALYFFVGFYVTCVATTWWQYVRTVHVARFAPTAVAESAAA